jgi:putative transposase
MFKPLNEILIKVLESNKCLLHIWLLMPDHCHMIVEAGQTTKNILRTIDKFKQHSGYWFYKNKLNIKWKKSYYDHILRSEKDVENKVYYILNNPVRKELVESWKEYPYKYSAIYDLNEL